MTTAELEREMEEAAEAMASPPRGQAGRFPARRLPSHLRRQGFLVTRHFLDRLVERAQRQGIRFDPRNFANDFRAALHFRQTRPGYNTRFALLQGLPVLYRMGGWRGLNPVLVGLLPQGALPPATRVAAPRLREAELEQELEEAALELSERCPPDQPNVVRGFSRYSNDISLLPLTQQNKVTDVANEISKSFTDGGGPVAQVQLVGHADFDPVRESREAGFMRRMSKLRADKVSQDLQVRVGQPNASRIAWNATGVGATFLAVPNPLTETERACNRRVEIALVRGAPPPPPMPTCQGQGDGPTIKDACEAARATCQACCPGGARAEFDKCSCWKSGFIVDGRYVEGWTCQVQCRCQTPVS